MSAEEELEFPDPSELLDEAESENPRRILGNYHEAIQVLKNSKRFTFREIAEWLTKRGVPCDHNGVYREYTKFMHPPDAVEVGIQDEEVETEEAIDEARQETGR